jgi:glucan-binding YG repeat protein
MDDSERTYGYSEDIYHGSHDRKDEKSYEYGAENPAEVDGEALSPEEAAMHVEGPRPDDTVEAAEPGSYDYGREGGFATTESFTWDLSATDEKEKPKAEGSGKSEKKTEPSLSEQRLEPAKREP